MTDAPPVVIRLQQALALYRQGHYPAAEDLLTRILVQDPANGHAVHLLGLVVEQRGDYEMAEQLLYRAYQLAPHSRVAQNLSVVQMHRGDLDGAIATARVAIEKEPDYADAWTHLLFALDAHPYAGPDLLRAEREAFDRACCERWTALAAPHANSVDPNRRLRIGYLSADFRTLHSASGAFWWLTAHDRDQFAVCLYSTAERSDPSMLPFRQAVNVWSEVGQLADGELAEAIRADGIDILVDLAGVSRGGRPLVMARKPAPVQIGGWGYPHGLGITAMDYLVGDDVAIPPSHAEHYPEQILRLPCLMGYRPGEKIPDVGDPPESRRGYRTYGYLGRAMKVTGPTLAAWAEILRANPTSRLLLKSPQYADSAQRERVLHGLVALGVSPSRIEIRGETSRYEHLVAHRECDVMLDPIGIGGGATVWDSCLMGVPTVTVPGEAVSGRIAASILAGLGIEQWIATGMREYIDIAVRNDPMPAQWVRARTLGSIGCDAQAYARLVEVQLREVWQRWCTTQREAA